MEYYSFVLSDRGYIERCLTALRYIFAPQSKTPPHITVRLLKKQALGDRFMLERNVAQLSVIGPGRFETPIYEARKKREHSIRRPKGVLHTLFLRCESDDLELFEYKPDYPFSRLHLTMLQSEDNAVVEEAEKLLSSIEWNMRLKFENSTLVKRTVGGTKTVDSAYQHTVSQFFAEDLKEDFLSYACGDNDTKEMFRLVKKTLEKLDEYCHKANVTRAKSKYLDEESSIADSIIRKSADFGLRFYDSISKMWALKIVDSSPYSARPILTPPEYAEEMAHIGLGLLGEGAHIHFGDSSIGTGGLYSALYYLVEGGESDSVIDSAIGIDSSIDMAIEAARRFGGRNLEVYYGDSATPDSRLISSHKRNLMLVNPPYTRYQDLPSSYREELGRVAYQHTGIKLANDAGLYAFHLLIMDKWLAKGGVAVWLLPISFMQTQYGKAVRDYLLNKVTLLRIHTYDHASSQFDNASVSTAIVAFRKGANEDSSNDREVVVTHGESAKLASNERHVSIRQLKKSDWQSILLGLEGGASSYKRSGELDVTFEDLFTIKRGIATGANRFFVMTPEEASERGIPSCALTPVLPKARYFKGNVVEADEHGYPKSIPYLVMIDTNMTEDAIQEQYPRFYEYLQSGKTGGDDGAVINRTLIRRRSPWYKQEERAVPPLLLTYMGRNVGNRSPLYFIRNKSNAVALNTYILLYPKESLARALEDRPGLWHELWSALVRTADEIITPSSRLYVEGLRKLEPGELRRLPIVGLSETILGLIPKRLELDG